MASSGGRWFTTRNGNRYSAKSGESDAKARSRKRRR